MSTKTVFRKTAIATTATTMLASAGLGLALAQPASAHGDAPATAEVRSTIAATRAGTAAFHQLDTALQAGYVPVSECVPGMGVHHADIPAVFDGVVDPSHPEALVYHPTDDGGMRLVAVEFIVPDHGQARPDYAGVPFDGPSTLAGMPVYTLHVWTGLNNEHGIFTPHNPAATC